jgi:hypothetical protein
MNGQNSITTNWVYQPPNIRDDWFPFNIDELLYPQPSEIVKTGKLPTATPVEYLYKTENAADAESLAFQHRNCAFLHPQFESIPMEYNFTGTAVGLNLDAGTYKFECWGAQCGVPPGGVSPGQYNNLGGYTKGIIKLTEPTNFVMYIGGQGGRGANTMGGWNGGGGNYAGSITLNDNSNGGGATDISIVDSLVTVDAFNRTIRQQGSYIGRIMVAGGGGGGRTTMGAAQGGSGAEGTPQIAGTQTQAGVHSQGNWTTRPAQPGGFGYGASTGFTGDDDPAGGGGYYGGGIQQDNYGGGGSSFVSGGEGMNAVDITGTPTGQPNHYSGFVFTDVVMTAGEREGHGKIVITQIFDSWGIKMVTNI